ncbi:glycosyltransferase family 2 protein [Novosphingobium malaysiense]|uniref:Glycosyl transferase n=1 Tax=Novosphingobium malaysiense TaxID=1348853 RepID=A0A0B1ZM95_9SPHN|nr:glycosyltransferase [Novosphingobium malaysiense]KHK90444.1 glycosyl transferase [Novosphingobium malaysiense]
MARIAIEHIDASCALPELARETARTLIVFWWGDVPVGQVIDEGIPGERIDLERHWAEFAHSPACQRAASRSDHLPRPPLDVSVVICTRDRPDALKTALESLAHQSLKPREVIVVDNASADARTREVAEAAGVRYVREDRPGLSFARNSGIHQAAADIIAFTDDDVALHPRWLERLAGALCNSKAVAVTGLVLPAELETEAQQHFETFWSFNQGYEPIEFDAGFFSADKGSGADVWNIGAGANMAFHRRAFDVAGYFDTRLGAGAAGCSEDSEFWHRILSLGGTCRYEPSAVVYHFHRRDMAGLRSQIYQYMKGHAAALLVQYERTGNRGSLRRLLFLLPAYDARRVWRKIRYGARPENRFLWQEIAGIVAGIGYYLHRGRARTP